MHLVSNFYAKTLANIDVRTLSTYSFISNFKANFLKLNTKFFLLLKIIKLKC